MNKKLIIMNHHVDDYECMWNGIEDIYRQKSGEELPPGFFFCLSGIGKFIYLKNKNMSPKRRAAWGDGRTKKMYQSISDIVGFHYRYIEGKTFSYTLKKAKEQIDMDKPVILGCLDMYYLNYYPKLYHKAHIPIHYVMMVGYDDEKQCVYIQDNGIAEVQEISYEVMQMALNIEKTSLSDKNTICCIEFEKTVKSIIEIAKEAFYRKAKFVLDAPAGFVGIRGMYKFAEEFPKWKEELSPKEYEEALTNMVMFSGTVPQLPSRLCGIEESEKIYYMAWREKIAVVLNMLGGKYKIKEWEIAAGLFIKSGKVIEDIVNQIVDYLLGERENLIDIPILMNEIAKIEEAAYTHMLIGAEGGQISYGKNGL